MSKCFECHQELPVKPAPPAEFLRAIKHFKLQEMENHAVHNLRIMLQALTEAGVLDNAIANTVYEKLDYDDYVREAN
jgi:hypothetical protein